MRRPPADQIYRRRPIFYSLGNFIFHVRSEKVDLDGTRSLGERHRPLLVRR